MCKTCNFIDVIFNSAKFDAHSNYYPILKLLEQIEKQKRIELIAGDCFIEEVPEVLFREEHYTVCHYFKCSNCDTYIFIGACIRGTPIFKLLNKIDSDFPKLLWGTVGSYFENKK